MWKNSHGGAGRIARFPDPGGTEYGNGDEDPEGNGNRSVRWRGDGSTYRFGGADDEGGIGLSKNGQIGLSTIFMAGIGTVVGGIIGAFPREQWQVVSPVPARLRIAARADGGLVLGASVWF